MTAKVIKLIPKILSQHAFSAGFKAFYEGRSEVCDIPEFTDIQQKEFMRGWWGAYEKSRSESLKRFPLSKKNS